MTERFRRVCRVKKIAAGALAACAGLLFAAQAFAADLVAVRLKSAVNVESSDIRMGDLFDGAGDAAMSVFGMAPGPGRSMSYSASYVQAKAKQAGLNWDNAENVATVTISHGAAIERPAPEASVSDDPFTPKAQKPTLQRAGGADVKRGDTVQIVYRAPGIQLMATGKATADATIGGKARAVNLRSNKTVEGTLVSAGRIEALSFEATDAQTALLEQPR